MWSEACTYAERSPSLQPKRGASKEKRAEDEGWWESKTSMGRIGAGDKEPG